MRSRAAIVGGVCLALAATPASALAKKQHKKAKPKPSYYLALGDSLAAGAQPNAAGTTVATDQGYVNDLYATEKQSVKGLKLEQLGCLGETTSSMLNGGSFCKYKGAQLADAVKFIKSHKIAFVTLDIGANDIDNCASGTSINTTCVFAGLGTVSANVPKIVSQLRAAVGRKGTIIGMTYYDPFLAEWLQGAAGQTLAGDSVILSKQFNGDLTTAFAAQKVKVADVATAFDTYAPFSQTTPFSGYYSVVPVAVAQICVQTWMCAAAPQGPNIHATPAGYKTIAGVFAKQL